jgi:hypothetical protein
MYYQLDATLLLRRCLSSSSRAGVNCEAKPWDFAALRSDTTRAMAGYLTALCFERLVRCLSAACPLLIGGPTDDISQRVRHLDLLSLLPPSKVVF